MKHLFSTVLPAVAIAALAPTACTEILGPLAVGETSGAGGSGGSCSAPEERCADRCVDTSSDPANCGGCGIVCAAGLSCACSGTCMDTTTDSKNCGSCGHDCQGGMCQGSICQPVKLATGQNNPSGIAIDATSVYWTNVSSGTVMKVVMGSDTPVTLALGEDSPTGITVGATNVYWANRNTVMTLWIDGGTTPKPLVSSQNNSFGIAVDATNAYWTNYADGGAVMKVALKGAPLSPSPPAKLFHSVLQWTKRTSTGRTIAPPAG